MVRFFNLKFKTFLIHHTSTIKFMVSLKIGKMVVVMDMFINIYIYINLNITYEHIQHTQKHSYI